MGWPLIAAFIAGLLVGLAGGVLVVFVCAIKQDNLNRRREQLSMLIKPEWAKEEEVA